MARMFRDILVAIDASATAARAFDRAGELALALNARLTVISVVPHVSSGAYRAPVDIEALRKDVERETQKLIADAVDRLPEGLPITTVLKHGDAGKRIVEQLEAGGYDLLVMGSRGRGRVASNLLGSVAAHVYFHSRVAMLVIQPDDGGVST
jgi:nucleotide-binding universal stress UspA family protein